MLSSLYIRLKLQKVPSKLSSETEPCLLCCCKHQSHSSCVEKAWCGAPHRFDSSACQLQTWLQVTEVCSSMDIFSFPIKAQVFGGMGRSGWCLTAAVKTHLHTQPHLRTALCCLYAVSACPEILLKLLGMYHLSTSANLHLIFHSTFRLERV